MLKIKDLKETRTLRASEQNLVRGGAFRRFDVEKKPVYSTISDFMSYKLDFEQMIINIS